MALLFLQQYGSSFFLENKNFRRIFFIFLIALAARLFVFGFLMERLGPAGLNWVDSGQYMTLAKNMAQGHGFSLSRTFPYVSDTLRTPGYPLYLAFFYYFFGNFWSAALFQAFVNSFVPVLVFLIAKKLTPNMAIAAVASILVALEPHLLLFSIALDTEGIFVLLLSIFMLALFLFWDTPLKGKAIFLGFLFGYLSLTRPVFLYALPLLMLFFLWRFGIAHVKKGIFFAVCIFFMASVIPPFFWMQRNYHTNGEFTLSTIGWVNLYTRMAATVHAAAHHQSFQESYTELLTGLRDEGIIHDPLEYELYDAKFIPILKERSFKIFKRYPKETFLLQPISLQAIFTQDDMLYILNHTNILDPVVRPPIPLSLLLLEKGFFGIMDMIPYLHGPYILSYCLRALWFVAFGSSFVGAWFLLLRGNADQRLMIWVLIACIIFFAVMTLPVAASINARYRLAFEPFYFIFVAAGIYTVFQKFASIFRRIT